MTNRTLLTCLAAAAVLSLHAPATAEGDKKPDAGKPGSNDASKHEKAGEKPDSPAGARSGKSNAAPKTDQETMKQMEAMMPKPTAEHARLKRLVGTWDYTASFIIGGGQPPQETRGTEVNRMVGEFWVISDSKSDMMGLPYEGHATYGYDVYKQKQVGTWIDSMTPEIMALEGDADKEGNVSYVGTAHEPMSKKEMKQRLAEEWADIDHRTMHSFITSRDGKEIEIMTIKYTRHGK